MSQQVLGLDGLVEAGGEGAVVDDRRQVGERRVEPRARRRPRSSWPSRLSSIDCSLSPSVASPSPASPSEADASSCSSPAAASPAASSEAPSPSSWSPVSSPSSSSSPLSLPGSSAMSRAERMSRTAPAKRSCRSMAPVRRDRSPPARSSMKSRHMSTILLRRCRRRVAGQALAHHQGDGVLERRLGTVG